MKLTKKKILTFALLLFMIIGTVNAESTQEEPFKFDWKTDSEYQIDELIMFYNNNTYYKNGYVTSTINLDDTDDNDIPKTYINRYNIQGELQTTKKLENKVILAITTNEEYIIALSVSYEESEIYKILLLDESLNIQKEITIDLEEEEEISSVIQNFKISGVKYFNIIDNKIYFYTSDYIKEVNLETGENTNYDKTDRNIKKYMNHLYVLSEEETDNSYFNGYDKKNNYEVLTGVRREGCGISNTDTKGINNTSETSFFKIYSNHFNDSTGQEMSCRPNFKGEMKLYNDGELVFDKIYNDYTIISTPYIINDYIVTIASKDFDTSEIIITIVIFDMEGNVIQEISEEEYYFNLVAGPSSFMTIGVNSVSNSRCPVLQQGGQSLMGNAGPMPKCYKVNNIVYYLPLNIETKITGEGTINVVDKARSGEEITYEVTPKEGYVLDTVKVTDASGNVVEYKTNTFTMPSLDVTIEVTFKKDILNPDTKDIATITIILALCVGLGFTIANYKKLRFLK